MNKCKGFSLLEILIAFAIAAIALGLLLRIFSGGVNNAIIADNYTTAVQIAESLLAKTGIETPLQQGQSTGVENNFYQWRVSVAPYQSPTLPWELMPENVVLMEIQVKVSWSESEALEPRFVELSTLRLITTEL